MNFIKIGFLILFANSELYFHSHTLCDHSATVRFGILSKELKFILIDNIF